MNFSHSLTQIYKILYDFYGPQSWWPADTPFEVMVGAILTQNTSWAGVEKAISGLKESTEMTPEGVFSLPLDDLEQAIRPSGYFRQKAERLNTLCWFLLKEYGGDLRRMEPVETRELRRQLLDLRGVGPETADSILLYALDRPVFVVDAYTARLLSRLGLCKEHERYDELQLKFMENLEHEFKLFNEYHALIVRHGKEKCRKRAPLCGECPLAEMCAWESKI